MKSNYVFIPVVPANLPLIEMMTEKKVEDRYLFGEHALVIEMQRFEGVQQAPTYDFATIEEIRQGFGEIASMSTTTIYHETRM